MADFIAQMVPELAPYSSYIYAIIIIVGAVVLNRVATFIIDRIERNITTRTKSSADDLLLDAAKGPIKLGILLVAVWLALPFLPFLTGLTAEINIAFTIIFPLYVGYFASKIVGAGIGWYSAEVAGRTESKIDDQFLPIIQRMAYAIIFGLMILLIMGQLGIEITTLIAAMGIGGLAIALALQPTLSNLFSGLQMVFDKPLKIGDFVEIEGGNKGTVIDIGWRSTRIRTYTNNIVTLPNSVISDSKIINYSDPTPEIGFIVEGGVSYGSDLEKVEKIALRTAEKVLKEHNGVEGFQPLFRYGEYAESSINFKVIMRTKTIGDSYMAKHIFIKELKKAFDKAKVEIPFPQMDVHFDEPGPKRKRK